ncbi:MAG: hypothetical protein ACREHF_00955 [Rhizomicrobium sp.]
MNTIQVAFAASALALAATAAPAASNANGVVGSGAGMQSQNQNALAARQGYVSPFWQPNSELALAQPRHGLLSWQADKLRQLRAEAVKRQQDDGGTLSVSDRAYLHAKLDRILVP